jgi:hypothetical protein
MPSNRVRELRFGATTNTLLDVPGGPTGVPGPFAFSPPAGVMEATFFVRRAVAGLAALVPLVVVDACGEWPTFVGGGPGAF